MVGLFIRATNIKKRTLGTHDGSFHADEVTACALLLLFDLIDWDKIMRTRDPQLLGECEFVCDVGGIYDPAAKLFDHHQVDYTGPLSSAGMILAYLQEHQIITQEEYQFFNDSLILGVDAHDNGNDPQLKGVTTYSHIIANFTPIHHDAEPEFQNSAFFQALDFSFGHLKRLHERYLYIQSCRQIVAEAMHPHQHYLFFEQSLPWMDSFFELGGANHPATFVIMPSGAHWKLRGIPPNPDNKMKVRIPLPENWAGLIEDDLRVASGIPGAIFCHKGRFISVWESKEDAFKALELVLSQQKT